MDNFVCYKGNIKQNFLFINTDRPDRSLLLAWPSAIRPIASC